MPTALGDDLWRPLHSGDDPCIVVMAALVVAAIHVFPFQKLAKAWMAGTSPAMTSPHFRSLLFLAAALLLWFGAVSRSAGGYAPDRSGRYARGARPDHRPRAISQAIPRSAGAGRFGEGREIAARGTAFADRFAGVEAATLSRHLWRHLAAGVPGPRRRRKRQPDSFGRQTTILGRNRHRAGAAGRERVGDQRRRQTHDVVPAQGHEMVRRRTLYPPTISCSGSRISIRTANRRRRPTPELSAGGKHGTAW